MSRSGFALVATLWFLVALSGISVAGMGLARTGVMASRNRSLLLRAEWAREACVGIVRARYSAGFQGGLKPDADRLSRRLLDLLSEDSVDLGGATWCRIKAEDAGSKVDAVHADSAVVACVLGDSVQTRLVLHGRAVSGNQGYAELLLRRPPKSNGVDDLTPYGTGSVNINTAGRRVVQCLPGLGPEDARLIVASRERVAGFGSLDELVAEVPQSVRERIVAVFPRFSRTVGTRPSVLVLTATGVSGARQLQSKATLLAVTDGPMLVVLRRESE